MREGSVRVPIRAAPSPGGDGLTPVTGIVLAGGRSTRFGRDKIVAELEGMPLVHHAVIRVAEACGDVVVVLAPHAEVPSFPPGLPVRVARDPREAEGPLAGLAAGLARVSSDRVLVAAGDMPWLSPSVLVEMLRVAHGTSVRGVALADGGRARPLPCVLMTTQARVHVHALRRSGERSLRALLGSLGVVVIDEPAWRALDPGGGTLRDVDTPSDLPGGGSIG